MELLDTMERPLHVGDVVLRPGMSGIVRWTIVAMQPVTAPDGQVVMQMQARATLNAILPADTPSDLDRTSTAEEMEGLNATLQERQERAATPRIIRPN